VGVGERDRHVEEMRHEQGVPTNWWTVPGRKRPETGCRGRRVRCACGLPNRGGGERLTGGQRLVVGEGGRRERRGARMGRPEKEGGGPSPDE
jgi:hypothetical protein